MINNRRLIEKDDAVVSLSLGGKLLSDPQLDKFFHLCQDQTVLAKGINPVVEHRDFVGDKFPLDTIGFSSRIIREPATVQASIDATAPSFGRNEISTKRVMLTVPVPFEIVEDNVEGKNFEDVVMEAATKQYYNDIEDLMFNGLGTGENGFLKIKAGLIAMLKADEGLQSYNTAGGTDFKATIFAAMLAALPNKWQANRQNITFLLSPKDAGLYEDSITTRSTDLGDEALQNGIKLRYKGIDVLPVPSIPDGTHLLALRRNAVLGWKRRVRVGKDVVSREDTLWVTITARPGWHYRTIEGFVLAWNKNV